MTDTEKIQTIWQHQKCKCQNTTQLNTSYLDLKNKSEKNKMTVKIKLVK